MKGKKLAELLVGKRNPTKSLKEALFEFHNSMVGKSIFFKKEENVRTMCGSCVGRVRVAFWQWYHFECEDKSNNLEFIGREGGGSWKNAGRRFTPLYKKI